MKIALFAGGRSAEREISFKSAKAVAEALARMDVTYRKFDTADPSVLADLIRFKPDVAFPAMHGPGGEDGCLQGFLETAGIPYVGSGVEASSVCMNKLHTKWAFEALGIPTPRWAVVEPHIYMERRKDKQAELPPFPAVVKPLREGSSVGVEFVETEEELRAILDRRKAPLLVEERIFGREITLPMFGDPLEMLPPIEIKPKAEFFDFDAKYTKGMTEYICPADISIRLREELARHANRIAQALNLKHMCRIDVMLSLGPKSRTESALPGMSDQPADGRPLFLEINTIPGMTETSLLPMSARAVGIEFPELIRKLIDLAGGVQ